MSVADDKGFTLVEALIALTVLMLGLLGLWRLHIATFRSDLRSHKAYVATQLAAAKVEELKAAGYSSLTPGSNADCCDLNGENCSANCGGLYFRREWSVDTPPGSLPKTLRITVQVGWDGDNCTANVSNCGRQEEIVSLVSDTES